MALMTTHALMAQVRQLHYIKPAKKSVQAMMQRLDRACLIFCIDKTTEVPLRRHMSRRFITGVENAIAISTLDDLECFKRVGLEPIA